MHYDKIASFLESHHLLSLATAGDELWCASAFYAFDRESVIFVFASDGETRHMRNIAKNSTVAGVVAFESKIIANIKGVQFSGAVVEATKSDERLYLERFSYAKVLNPTLYKIVINELKMTDNTLGFSKKLSWKREF